MGPIPVKWSPLPLPPFLPLSVQSGFPWLSSFGASVLYERPIIPRAPRSAKRKPARARVSPPAFAPSAPPRPRGEEEDCEAEEAEGEEDAGPWVEGKAQGGGEGEGDSGDDVGESSDEGDSLPMLRGEAAKRLRDVSGADGSSSSSSSRSSSSSGSGSRRPVRPSADDEYSDDGEVPATAANMVLHRAVGIGSAGGRARSVASADFAAAVRAQAQRDGGVGSRYVQRKKEDMELTDDQLELFLKGFIGNKPPTATTSAGVK